MFSYAISRVRTYFRGPGLLLHQTQAMWSGYKKWSRHVEWSATNGSHRSANSPNALRDFFESRKEGRGIWKWNHYFPIYDRHLSRFRGQDVHVLEIGIYSGGSLEMWNDYFGPRCHIYGVDIEPSCKAYEGGAVQVFIGDQADRSFWRSFKRAVGTVDIVIDDGGHSTEQQIATLEELLPHLRSGGVYLCEDVTGKFNEFASYVFGLARNLNAFEHWVDNVHNAERRMTCEATPLQSAVGSVHLYPYVVVIERTQYPVLEFVSPKRGSQWEPFLK